MKGKRKHRQTVHIFVSLLVTVLLLVVLFEDGGAHDFLRILNSVAAEGFALYVVLSLSSIVLRAMRYRILIEVMSGSEETPRLRSFLVVTAIRNAFVDFLPARLGEASYFYFVNRFGVSFHRAASSFGVCLVLDVLILGGIVALLFLHRIVQHATIFGGEGLVLAFAICGSLFLFVVLLRVDLLLRSLQTVFRRLRFSTERLQTALRLVLGVLHQMELDTMRLRSARTYGRLILLTSLLRIFKYGALYVLLVAVLASQNLSWHDLPLLESIIAFLAAEGSASLPFSGIMGFGAYEGAWSSVFALSSVQIEQPGLVILSVHVLTQVVGYSCGLLALCAVLLSFRIKST